MNIKKKLGMGMATALLGVGLIGGGTFAYFSDSEETNNTFAAGTLDLSLDHDAPGELEVHLENLKPGDHSTKQVILKNDGSLPIKDILLHTDVTVKDKNGNETDNDFASQLFVEITDAGAHETIVEKTSLDQLDDSTLAPNGIDSDKQKIYRLDFYFDETDKDQNEYQGNELELTMKYTANQEEGNYFKQ